MKKILLIISLVALLSGCAGTNTIDKDAQITQDWTVEKLYSEAKDELTKGNYSRSIKLYDILESRFPFGRYAQQAALDRAYARYRYEEPKVALDEINRFIKLHPVHPNMDYALYLKGIILFNEDQSIMNKLASQDWSERDPKANKEAFFAFQELVKRYPSSLYAPDSLDRMNKLLDALGGHEMHVSRYYMKRGAYLAAANRAQIIILEYQNTQYVEEALAIMVSAYDHLNLPDLRDDAFRVLQNSYPQSQYLKTPWAPIETPWYRYWK